MILSKATPEAIERLRSLALVPATMGPKLADALHAIAHDSGFASWPKLKEHVESLARASDPAEALTAAVTANDTGRVAQLLEHHPDLKAKLNDPMPNYPTAAPIRRFSARYSAATAR